ncbi:MAG: hypothetical protein LBI42_09545 [Chitinispirillales bacterium]|jgi:hypothetical protein|nr:hypothetical protein [Chitinispirillales bacterium]
MNPIIKIENDGQKIKATDFWESESAKNGICFLSVINGVYRLLIPKNRSEWLREIKKAQAVIISRGVAPHIGKQDALELMFEQKSRKGKVSGQTLAYDSPFSIFMGAEQCDPMPSAPDQGWNGSFVAYCGTTEKPAATIDKVYYRRVEKLPCLLKVAE